MHVIRQNWAGRLKRLTFLKLQKQKALSLCTHEGVSVNYQISEAEEFDFTPNAYDLVVLIYAHLNSQLRQEFHRQVVEALKPEGKVILEGFHPRQLKNNYASGGPKNIEMFYPLDILIDDFKDLDKTFGEELEIDLSEGKYHQDKAFMTRFTGKKKSSYTNSRY